MGGTASPPRRGRFRLARRRGHNAHRGRPRRRARGVVDSAWKRRQPRPPFLPWWRLLLRLHPEPSPHGDRGRRAAKVRTLAVGYRLAPEHCFPAAFDDALTAWRFLHKQGVMAKDIVIAGDSAGGGLTVALINRLRHAGDEQPACAWLVSPCTDLTLSGTTLVSKDAVDPLIHMTYLGELADAYLPAGFDRKDPRVSPLYSDLKGFPPTLIQVGSDETLLDDAVRFAGVAGAADVAITLAIWPHMIHAWQLWNAHLEAGRRALASAGSFMRDHL